MAGTSFPPARALHHFWRRDPRRRPPLASGQSTSLTGGTVLTRKSRLLLARPIAPPAPSTTSVPLRRPPPASERSALPTKCCQMRGVRGELRAALPRGPRSSSATRLRRREFAMTRLPLRRDRHPHPTARLEASAMAKQVTAEDRALVFLAGPRRPWRGEKTVVWADNSPRSIAADSIRAGTDLRSRPPKDG